MSEIIRSRGGNKLRATATALAGVLTLTACSAANEQPQRSFSTAADIDPTSTDKDEEAKKADLAIVKAQLERQGYVVKDVAVARVGTFAATILLPQCNGRLTKLSTNDSPDMDPIHLSRNTTTDETTYVTADQIPPKVCGFGIRF